MSISNWFETFNKNLRISTDNIDAIAYRYKRITKQINKDFWYSESETAHSLYVGSYGRDTETHTSDIDVIVQLPYEIYVRYNNYIGNGQSALLQAVKASIGKTYTSYMRADGQVIKIDFTDGINFEIVPAFINDDNSYTFPDTNGGGSWKTTNPRPEMSAIASLNNTLNKNLKRLCRMARAWKDKWSVPMGGLLIDTLAYNFLKDYTYKDKSYLYYDFISRDFFLYLSNLDKDKEYWLAVGSGQRVYKKGSFQTKASSCYSIALEAIEKEKDYPYTARSKWREIYGTKFPA